MFRSIPLSAARFLCLFSWSFLLFFLFLSGGIGFAEEPQCPLGEDWSFCPEFSDEFNGTALDAAKWWPTNPTWEGRQPAKFLAENVWVADGFLNLKADCVADDFYSEADKERGYNTFSTAAVKSRETVLYGYFEICARPMNSTASSSFWFYHSTGNGIDDQWTEIDVFEMSGKHPVHGGIYHMNLHVFKLPGQEAKHFSRGGTWNPPFREVEGFHKYGLEWLPDVIRWYVDGEVVREEKNDFWHQPLTVNFDSETMPSWFGLPDPADLPSTFSIDYIRCWKVKE